MTAHANILDQRDSLKGALTGAILLHGAIIGGLAFYGFLKEHVEPFGAIKAGGGIGVGVASPLAPPPSNNPNPGARPLDSHVTPADLHTKDTHQLHTRLTHAGAH